MRRTSSTAISGPSSGAQGCPTYAGMISGTRTSLCFSGGGASQIRPAPRGARQHTAHARPLLALDAEHGRAHCKRHGPCEVLRRWMAGGFDLVASPRQLHELQTVLAREKFRRYLTYEDATEYVSWLHHGAEVVRDPGENVVRGAVEADPDDEYLVGLTETLGGGDPPTSCPSVFTGAPFQPSHASLELTSGFRNTSGSAAKGRIRPD